MDGHSGWGWTWQAHYTAGALQKSGAGARLSLYRGVDLAADALEVLCRSLCCSLPCGFHTAVAMHANMHTVMQTSG